MAAKISSGGLIMTSIYLSALSRDQLKKLGKKQGITAAEALRRLISEYFASNTIK